MDPGLGSMDNGLGSMNTGLVSMDTGLSSKYADLGIIDTRFVYFPTPSRD